MTLQTQDIDLTACDREPIHIPGSIQPHGILLAIRLSDRTLAYASANIADTFRLDPELSIIQTGNDVDGWTQDRDNWEYWSTFVPEHPLLLLWVLILGLPLGAALRGRKRRIPVGAAPYQDAIRRERPAALRVDVGRGTATSGSA